MQSPKPSFISSVDLRCRVPKGSQCTYPKYENTKCHCVEVLPVPDAVKNGPNLITVQFSIELDFAALPAYHRNISAEKHI